jgi:DUF2075 family protein/predicted GIY-YIG superfamily endonuclease
MTNFEIKASPFDEAALRVLADEEPRLRNWPVVYTISDDKDIYIGETTSTTLRMNNHKGSDRKAHLKEIRIILHEKFNKSACLDLESHLIKYFHADQKYSVLNLNSGISDSDYFGRDEYRESFDEIFAMLREQGLMTRSIPDLVNSNIFKYSPFKALSNDQAIAIEGILDSLVPADGKGSSSKIVIQGGPGTGKTIVAVYLMKLIRDIATAADGEALEIDSLFSDYFQSGYKEIVKTWRIGLVIPQQSLRRTIQNVFKSIPGLDMSMVLSPFEVGKSSQKYDLLIVDEAHRLKLRSNMPSAAQNIDFKEINERLFGSDPDEKTQLDWVISQSENQILLIDAEQSVMPSDLTESTIKSLELEAKNANSYFKLLSQLRVQGGEKYIKFVSQLLKDGSTATDSDFSDYDFRLFDNFSEMSEELGRRESEKGLARLVAGYAWKWATKGVTDPNVFDIDIEGIKLAWNRTAIDWINSPTSINEVGSIHTVQGYDLNYCGVIIGRDLYFDESTNSIKFDRKNYFDMKGMEKNRRLGRNYSDDDIETYVKQIYRVLLTRGIYGTYVYVCDPKLRAHLKSVLGA